MSASTRNPGVIVSPSDDDKTAGDLADELIAAYRAGAITEGQLRLYIRGMSMSTDGLDLLVLMRELSDE